MLDKDFKAATLNILKKKKKEKPLNKTIAKELKTRMHGATETIKKELEILKGINRNSELKGVIMSEKFIRKA